MHYLATTLAVVGARRGDSFAATTDTTATSSTTATTVLPMPAGPAACVAKRQCQWTQAAELH